MKIYLAGPMQGYKDFNFPAFMEAATTLRAQGHSVFNPAERDVAAHGDSFASATGNLQDIQHTGFSLRDALYHDTKFICLEAEAIALLPGWENSKGARAEHALAVALGHRTIYL
jgi:predicted RNase H-like HicB family nuclease